MPKDWTRRAIGATRGTRFGAILIEALRIQSRLPSGVEARSSPYFSGAATVTSDGFVMCNFVDRSGNGHPSAFVGAASDLDSNVAGLASHLRLSVAQRDDLRGVIRGWIATDYRATR